VAWETLTTPSSSNCRMAAFSALSATILRIPMVAICIIASRSAFRKTAERAGSISPLQKRCNPPTPNQYLLLTKIFRAQIQRKVSGNHSCASPKMDLSSFIIHEKTRVMTKIPSSESLTMVEQLGVPQSRSPVMGSWLEMEC
jgi:hypothetical protein